MNIDIPQIMGELSELRPIFHSEADFQHALAWEIHRCFPEALIRLELPRQVGNEVFHLDLWFSQQNESVAIELKYKTRRLHVKHNDESYNLKGQSANPRGRYGFLKDLQRLEMVSTNPHNFHITTGYAIFLTNDSSYWKKSYKSGTIDTAFRLNEDSSILGSLNWDSAASPGTKKSQEDPINLKGTYAVKWQDYAPLGKESKYGFKYLYFAVT